MSEVEEEKSGVQKFFTGVVSDDMAAGMEADSRRWMMQCPKCGFERSIWDMGGIRYKAVGNSRNYMRCTNCGKRSWHKLYKREGEASEYGDNAPATSGATALSVASRRTRPATFWFILFGGILLASALLVWGIFTLVFALTQPVATVGDNFMTALRDRNTAVAYDLLHPDLQREMGGESGLATRVQDYRPTEWSWSTRQIRNGVGRMSGSFKLADASSGSVDLRMQQVGEDWRIVSMELRR